MSPFEPFRLNGLTLRNRIIKSATFEGMSPSGRVTDDLIAFHRRVGQGGAALSTVAYGAVSPAARTFDDQIVLCEAALSDLTKLTAAVHETGAAASIQLAHGGAFSKHRAEGRRRTKGASSGVNTYGILSGIPFAAQMSEEDMARTADDYEQAARLAKSAGFDCVEIHLGHGYLLCQFLSPALNRRRDTYGGSLENRMRFPLEVVSKIREAVGEDFPVLARINLNDGIRGGIEVGQSIEIARHLEHAGVDGLIMSGGNVGRAPMYLMRGTVPRRQMVAAQPKRLDKIMFALGGPFVMKTHPFEEMFFLEDALKMRAAVQLPLF